METPDPEVILPGKLPTVAIDHLFVYVTLWMLLFLYTLHPWNLLVPRKHQFILEHSISHLFPTSPSHYRKFSLVLYHRRKFSIV